MTFGSQVGSSLVLPFLAGSENGGGGGADLKGASQGKWDSAPQLPAAGSSGHGRLLILLFPASYENLFPSPRTWADMGTCCNPCDLAEVTPCGL